MPRLAQSDEYFVNHTITKVVALVYGSKKDHAHPDCEITLKANLWAVGGTGRKNRHNKRSIDSIYLQCCPYDIDKKKIWRANGEELKVSNVEETFISLRMATNDALGKMGR